MSPRRNRPPRARFDRRREPAPVDLERVRRGVESVQMWRSEQWRVRQIPGSAAVKTYRCPGCDHEISPGVPHVVAWPVDSPDGVSERRHWHTGCWRARDRRGPR